MENRKVGVKTPGVGVPLSVEGKEVRALPVLVGVGLGVAVRLGMGEGVKVADGVASKEGSSLVSAARIVKRRLTD